MLLPRSERTEILVRLLQAGGLKVEKGWPARKGGSTFKLDVYVPELHLAFDLRGRIHRPHFQHAMEALGIIVLCATRADEKNWRDEESFEMALLHSMRQALADAASVQTRKGLAAKW